MNRLLKSAADKFIDVLGKIHWEFLAKLFDDQGRYYRVTDLDRAQIRHALARDYYIILTRRKTHLSTYAINLSHWVLSGFKKWGYYSHALMNAEDLVRTDEDFRLMEATNKTGVSYNSFDEIFDCDSVVLLQPRTMPIEDWTAALDNLKTHEGKTYDTIYDLADATQMSCVELVRTALMATPHYHVHFGEFEKMIASANNLDPHMFYECSDFVIKFEVRH